VSGAAADTSSAAAARREAGLATENRDLLERLASTQHQLRQLRACSQQRDAVQQGQVGGEG
jgi:hypothetical protein